MSLCGRAKIRSSLEMYCAILEGAREPIRQTKLMYITNINPTRLKEMLKELTQKSLISCKPILGRSGSGNRLLSNNPKSRYFVYQTTDKGLFFAEKWRELKSLWEKER